VFSIDWIAHEQKQIKKSPFSDMPSPDAELSPASSNNPPSRDLCSFSPGERCHGYYQH
jgi:hypothetical protein